MPPTSTKKKPIAKKKLPKKVPKNSRSTLASAGTLQAKSGKVRLLTGACASARRSKHVHVGLFHDEQACADAVARKRAEIEEKVAKTLHTMAQTLPHTRNLPPRPAKEADAKLQTAYYGEKWYSARGAAAKEFGPTRYVLMNNSSTASGFQF